MKEIERKRALRMFKAPRETENVIDNVMCNFKILND